MLTAHKELQMLGLRASPRRGQLQAGLDRAIRVSFANLPVFDRALVAVDNSASMATAVAGSQAVLCSEVAALFGFALANRSNADLMEFGTKARYLKYDRSDSPLRFATTFQERNQVGFGTNFDAIFAAASRRAYKRIIILSDMQSNLHQEDGATALRRYRRRSGADPWVYSIDLRGYGSSHFPTDGQRYVQLAGFSEKLFDLIATGQMEQNPQALVRRIEAVAL